MYIVKGYVFAKYRLRMYNSMVNSNYNALLN